MPIQCLSYLGGLNEATSYGTLPPNQLITADNIRYSGANAVSNGSSTRIVQLPSSGQGVTGVYYSQGSGNSYFLVSDRINTKILKTQVITGAMSFTDITGAATISTGGSFEIINGIVFYGAGANGLYQWNGAGNIAAVGGSSPSNVNILKVCNNFLFASYDSDASGTIYWSNVADGTSWNASSSATFRQNDGDLIKAFSSFQQDLIIFKGNSIGRLSTQTTIIAGAVTLGPLTTLFEGVGCIHRNSIDHLPDGRIVFFGTDHHLYIFDGSSITDISDPAFPLSNVQSDFNGFYGTTFVRVYPPRHEIWVVYPAPAGSGQNIKIYNYIYGSWYTSKMSVSGSNCTALIPAISSGVSFNHINLIDTHTFNNQVVMASMGANGYLYIEDCFTGINPRDPSPVLTLELSVPVPSDSRPNYQSFFIIPFQTSSANQTITYFIGRDGTYGSSKTFNSTGGWDRLKIPLTSSGTVTSFQVKIQYTSTSVSINFDPAYMSNEVVQ